MIVGGLYSFLTLPLALDDSSKSLDAALHSFASTYGGGH